MFKRDYSQIDEATGEIYLIRIASEKEDDWTIEVYDKNKTELLQVIDYHNFLEIPKKLRVSIKLDIDRAQANIAADKLFKKS